MPDRAPAHLKLETMAGTWRGEERIRPAPWDPAGGSASALIVNRLALGGQVLVQDYEQARGGRPAFTGHGVLRWDDAEQVYVFHWFDSLRTTPAEFRGSFGGGVLTLVRREPRGSARAVWEFAADGQSYQYRMDVSGDGERWTPYLEGAYVRESGGGSA
ncbi:DUF1579 family protein [Longimicrobium sp.]|uniref:DUF1579 family protein n=1 Tax=Longimicrobium sp. TaxID=2029185 RepID=UPI002D7FF5BB|nr:DUF1579 family protein [Longimicrobium sp.]